MSECVDGGGEGRLSRAKCVFYKARETVFIYLLVCVYGCPVNSLSF